VEIKLSHKKFSTQLTSDGIQLWHADVYWFYVILWWEVYIQVFMADSKVCGAPKLPPTEDNTREGCLHAWPKMGGIVNKLFWTNSCKVFFPPPVKEWSLRLPREFKRETLARTTSAFDLGSIFSSYMEGNTFQSKKIIRRKWQVSLPCGICLAWQGCTPNCLLEISKGETEKDSAQNLEWWWCTKKIAI